MARKTEQIQREHLTDAEWEKFCRLMELTVKLKAKIVARRAKQAREASKESEDGSIEKHNL